MNGILVNADYPGWGGQKVVGFNLDRYRALRDTRQRCVVCGEFAVSFYSVNLPVCASLDCRCKVKEKQG